MPLFHPRILQKSLKPPPLLPATHQSILADWRHSIESGQIFKQKETSLHHHFVQKILIEILGYQGFSSTTAYSLYPEYPVGKGRVDIALGHFRQQHQQIMAPLELKGAKTKDLEAIMPGRHKSPVQQAWEYAMDAVGAKWVLVSNYLEIRLYAIGYGRQVYEVWDLSKLTDLLEYTRFILLLSKDNLLEGPTEQLLKASEQVDKEITNQLYQDYKNLRYTLIRTFKADNPSIDDLNLIYYAQLILDRVLFIAFAEDTGLLPQNSLKKAYQHQDPYQPRPIWENFKGLFQAINKGNSQLNIPAYNGGLFQEDAVLNQLVVSDSLSEQLKQIGEYDFESEVSVTVLGHIFEQSISDLEELRTEAQGLALEKVGKRKREGVVYTPDNITRFMVEATLGRYLTEQFNQLWNARYQQRYQRGNQQGAWKKSLDEITFWRDYQSVLKTVKVVDPACGSGAFLVAAFDYLHAEYLRINDQLQALTGSYGIFDLDKEILNQNLYGVDVNSESIEITKLSLWLKTAKRGKVLNSLDHNLRVGDSLIEDSDISQRAFSWQLAFPEVFAAGGFDVVLGNPPYVRQELISSLKPYLQKQYQIYHGVADLYTYFFERGLKLLKPQGKLGFICSSTFFKTGSGEPLRHYLSTHTTIETIVDFGDLQVFAGVTTYPAILVLKKIKPNESHLLEFLKLEQLPATELSKIFHLHKSTMPQVWLSQDSWRLEEAKLVQLRQKIVSGKPTLKAVYGSPYRGILTGFNEAFVIDKATRDKLVAQDPKSAEVIKPFLEGKDLKKWRVESRELYLIFTRRGINIDDYPAIKAHLEQYREQLEPKPKDWQGGWKGRKAGSYQWFEIQDTIAYYPEFEKEKIVYPEMSQGAKFSMDKHSLHINNKIFFICNSDYFLLGLLNSYLIWFFLFGICSALRGGIWRLELRSIYIETIPIPPATNSQKTKIATLAQQCQHLAETRYQKQEAIRHRIPDLCPTNRELELSTKLKTWWTLDFKAFREEIKKCFKADIPLVERNDWETWLTTEKAAIEQLNQQLAQLEQQLNQKVYELFELTEEEIRLVEDNI